MTEHLPECPMSTKDSICCCLSCICDTLRDCEARVLREAQLRVAAIRDLWPVMEPGTIRRSEAIAAIKSGGWNT